MSDSGELRPRSHSKLAELRRGLRKARSNWFVAFLIDFVVIVGTAMVLSVAIKAFLIRSFYIPSGSMLETLQINDRIIVNVMAPELVPIEHGDVVVFRDPGGWLGAIPTTEKEPIQELTDFVLGTFGITAPDSAEHLVKRVIGLPGDTVECCDPQGRLLINGVPIDEPYLAPGANPSDVEFKVTIPEGNYWVMGDNRGNSTDSRFHQDLPSKGFVDESFIVGKAFVISWPIAHFEWLSNFPEVFSDVPKP
ncbi:MAG: signal peptidase I [Actinobacteria bacterium]|nr:signal peptidase I [Actinomycetota bacterium]